MNLLACLFDYAVEISLSRLFVLGLTWFIELPLFNGPFIILDDRTFFFQSRKIMLLFAFVRSIALKFVKLVAFLYLNLLSAL